jgi:flagellar hook-associated protein 3 FlgL
MGMRISTSQIYNTGVSQLSTLQSNLLKTQQQLSTGRRVLTPADDPVASARALEVTQSQEVNTQFATNRRNADGSLSQVDLALSSVSDLLDDVKDTILYAGNPALSAANREALAVDLEGRLQDLLGLANTADATGGYLFSGFKTNTQPFAQTATGATYYGDQGVRELRVGSGRQLPISASGSAIFESNVTGNGTFLTEADPGNVTRGGTGIISPGSVVDASLLTGHDYQVDFSMGDRKADAEQVELWRGAGQDAQRDVGDQQTRHHRQRQLHAGAEDAAAPAGQLAEQVAAHRHGCHGHGGEAVDQGRQHHQVQIGGEVDHQRDQ